MAEGWLVQESLVYISEFIGRRDESMPLLWENKEDQRMVGEVPQGNGLQRKMDSILEEKINRFCILNHPAMEKWVQAYEVAKANNTFQREQYRRLHQNQGNSVQFPPELKELPKFITISWLFKAFQEASLAGETVTTLEKEFAMGCSRRYKSFGALWSYGRHFCVHRIDHKRQTCDSGVMASFEQEIQGGHNGEVQVSNVEYCGRIQTILEVDFRSFQMFLLDVQWFKAVTQGRNPTIQRDASGFVAINSTRLWTNRTDTFVLAETCEQVIFQPVPTKPAWWYVVQVAPRSKQIYEEHDLMENIVNTDQLASTSTPSQTQSYIVTTIEEMDQSNIATFNVEPQMEINVTTIEEMESNIAEPNVEPQMENQQNESQTDEEIENENEERQSSDEEFAEELLMNNDQVLSGKLNLFIDIFAQQDLIDDENDCALEN